MSTESNDNSMTGAAEVVDDKTSAAAAEDHHEEPKTAKGLMSAMKKHSDGTNVFKESIKTFSNPFGTDKKTDIFVSTKEEGVALLKKMIATDKGKYKESSKKFQKWNFRSSPHEQFDKTLDDSFGAFVQWAMKKPNKEEDSEEEVSFNVSKAFRRVEQYAEWMEDHADEVMADGPLTAKSVEQALKAWNMTSSIDDNGNYVWFLDLKQVDRTAVKTTLSVTDSLRCYVWYGHFVMYNENAQTNGFIMAASFGKLRFIEAMTLVPMKLGVKIDRLTIGVLPIKMTACYISEPSAWVDIVRSILGVFMSKKMKERVIVLKDFHELEGIVGKDCIPKKFGELEGSLEVDLVDVKYFS